MLTRRQLPVAAAPHAPSPFDQIIGESRAIRALREAAHEILDRVAGNPTPPPVVITGETGTGKDLLARVMHAASPRAEGPFFDVCVVAIPEVLLEVELFGCVRGAFDGVGRARQGLFHAASGGTLLLSSSGDMLRAVRQVITATMERGAVRRIGSTRPEPVDVWVMATDHAPWTAWQAGRSTKHS